MKNLEARVWDFEDILDKRLNKYIFSEEHENNCIACSEGQSCCLDEDNDSIYNGKRSKIKEIIRDSLKESKIIE